jgi:uncharacterized protein
MSERLPGLPAPETNPVNEGYWLSAAKGTFVIQRCGDCGSHRHPPAAICYKCLSTNWSWDPDLPGTGKVFSYTWIHRPVLRSLSSIVPYNVSIIEIDGTQGEPVRVASNVFQVGIETLRIDLPVSVIFDPCGERLALPAWVPSWT